jgi:hypothetical protein
MTTRVSDLDSELRGLGAGVGVGAGVATAAAVSLLAGICGGIEKGTGNAGLVSAAGTDVLLDIAGVWSGIGGGITGSEF